LLFGAEHPLSFAPSIGLLLALRQRRRDLPNGMSWRPHRIFDFAVWRFGDKPVLAEALEQAAREGGNAARARGFAHEAKIGREADGPSLLAGLSRSDVTRIACHGRILPNAEAVDLLVAADGLLPPIAVAALENSDAQAHILGWPKLADLDGASPVVFCSACDSGAAILHAGGERLGLERPLFAAGVDVFVAPQWPVPAVPMQQFMSKVFEDYLSDPTRSLAAALLESRTQATAAGMPPLAVEALAVFGDGL
jgi:CHAT domain-containing protein